TLTSMSGGLHVEVRTSPQPPSRGLQSAQYRFTDGSGATATGLSLAVLPWMPIMAHGTSFAPTVSETAPGQFEIDNIYFSMPGLWSLRSTISTAGGTTESPDYVEPSFDIP
ncbi:MAG TPA: FixH family protein, partial [Polyangiaceae bacterium]